MNPHTFHQWITRKYGFFTRHRRKYPTLVHLRFPQRKISLARYLLIKHEHITIFPQLRNRVYSFNHRFYLKFDLFFPQYHLHPAIQILPFQTGVNTRFTPTIARKRPAAAAVGANFMFARTIGKIRVDSEKDLYHYRDSHHSYHRQVQTGHEHEIVQLFHRFYRLQSTAFPDSLPGPFTGEGYYPTPVMVNNGDPGKFEIRISKFETNSNDKNSNNQNEKNLSTLLYQHVFASNFEHYSRTTAIIPGKSLAGIVNLPTYFFEPRRHAKGREEEKKRGNEETEKRRREGEGFLKRLEPGSIYRSMIMSKTIPLSLDPGKEAFHMVRRTLIGPPRRGVDPGKEGFQMARMGLLRLPTQWGLFFFTRNRYDLNAAAVTTEKSLARMVKFSTYFFEPRRHEGSQLAVGSWQLAKREETGKRRREGEGFLERLEPGSIYRSMIMSKNISHGVDFGKEAFFSSLHYSFSAFGHAQAGTTLFLQELSERRHTDLFFYVKNRYDSNASAVTIEKSLARMFKFPTYFFEPRRHERSQLAVGSWQLARREEARKRRNEETEKRGREEFRRSGSQRADGQKRSEDDKTRVRVAEGFPKRLERDSLYRLMIMSRNISHVDDPGKEGFYMARMGLLRLPTLWGPKRLERDSFYRLMMMSRNISHVIDSGKEAFQMVRRTLIGPSRYAPRRGVDTGKEAFYRHEGNQLARREEMWKRRNEETKKRSREDEGLPRLLGWSSLFKSMLMSKKISLSAASDYLNIEMNGHVSEQQGPDKRGAFTGIIPKLHQEKNGRQTFVSVLQYSTASFLRRLVERGDVEADVFFTKNANDINTVGISFKKSLAGEEGISKKNRFTPSLDYFTPQRVSVGDRDQSLIDAGKPGSPAMDARDKITNENIFGNYASPGISQQQGPNIDIDQLTDRVYRVLEDKIRTEKEMRGW